MSRKDYETFAAILASNRETVKDESQTPEEFAAAMITLDRVTQEIADAFEKDNSRFDRQHFYGAAGYKL